MTTETFASAGTTTWIAPVGVFSVQAECEGAGGGGAATSISGDDPPAGGSGGGGAYAKATVSVTPGVSYAVTVGAGGSAAKPGTAGTGGSSSFGGTIVKAVGGAGASGTSGGAGGQAANCIGTTRTSGGNGGNGDYGPTISPGGSGAPPLGGAGAGVSSPPGVGGGGAGGVMSGGVAPTNGGVGKVVLTYTALPGAGSATGTDSFSGTATGHMDARGAVSGAAVWTGASAGRVPSRLGSATGGVAWSGTGSGRASPDDHGQAHGAFVFAGNVSGTFHAHGRGSEVISFATSAVGHKVLRFTPPTYESGVPGGDILFSRYAITTGVSVVKVDGHYQQVMTPWLGEIAGLVEGVDWFQGGRTYLVDGIVGDHLEADGFAV